MCTEVHKELLSCGNPNSSKDLNAEKLKKKTSFNLVDPERPGGGGGMTSAPVTWEPWKKAKPRRTTMLLFA